MNISENSISNRRALALAVCCLATAGAWAGEWSDLKPVLYRGDIVMTYRARLAGEWLVVEATHTPGWHTYAMDNLLRAQKATGLDTPETEGATRIEVGGGLEVAGPWKQSPPQDLSNRDIRWYTWGFSDTARFAVKVKRTGDRPGVITVNAQSCNESLCSMVRDLKISVPPDGQDDSAEAPGLLEGLVEVAAAAPNPEV